MTPKTTNFNAHHSPMGAYLTFTCGHHGTHGGGGGLAAQLGKPANQDLYIGYKNAPRHTPSPLLVLPFFNNADKIDPTAAFLPQKPNEDRQTFSPFTPDQLTREYNWSTDRWKTTDGTGGGLEFNIYSPWGSIPDPATASDSEMRTALLPAITAELIIDNRTGTKTKTGFFSINFQDPGNRILENLPPGRVAFAHRSHYGIAADLFDMTQKGSPPPVDPKESSLFPFLRWWPHEGLEDRSNPIHLLGTTPGIAFEIPPGKRYTLRLALACYLPDIVTTRLEGRYLYTRYFKNLEHVLNHAADTFCDLKQKAKQQDEKLKSSGLSEDQQFLIAHSTRSYYANTQLLDMAPPSQPAAPYWIVNEGEYCMMNTLDLAVDHVFWELDQNPWVVKNLLDNFLKHYSYTDHVKLKTTENTESTETTKNTPEKISVPSVVNSAPSLAPGGLSFTHDQGTHNQFSPFGHSAYEQKDLTGCFSYMTQEQLCNWILIATTYVEKTGDREWVATNTATIQQCFQSMIARRESEGGMMYFDSALCGTGSEITTYDSLDVSLGQARSNIYLAIKCWAAYIGLRLLSYAGGDKAQVAHFAGNEIEKLERNLASIVRDRELFPAVFELDNPGFNSRILPAIEALIFPQFWNKCTAFPSGMKRAKLVTLDEQTPLEPALRKHTITLLSDPQHRNKFEDNGIKLSSTSDNSWLSKIAIVQHVARSLFNLDENGNTRNSKPETGNSPASGWEKSDAAHVQWLTSTGPGGGGAYWCACDQIVNGIAKGSKYYPRLITTTLWLRECHIAPGLPGTERAK